MAATLEQKKAIAREFIRNVHIGQLHTANVDMDDLLIAAEDAYNWVETKQAEYNSALSTPFKSLMIPSQKAELLMIAIQEFVKAS